MILNRNSLFGDNFFAIDVFGGGGCRAEVSASARATEGSTGEVRHPVEDKDEDEQRIVEDDESLVTWTCHTKLANASGYIIQIRYLKLNISHYASHMRHISSLQFAMVHH